MPGRISKHAFAVQLGRAETKHVRRRVGDTLDHDVEVHLLRDGRVRPGRRTMVRSELEREPGGRAVGRDDHELVACVRDRVVQECGVEPRERSWVRTVEDDVVQASAHALNGLSRQQLPHSATGVGQRTDQSVPSISTYTPSSLVEAAKSFPAGAGIRNQARPFRTHTVGPSADWVANTIERPIGMPVT